MSYIWKDLNWPNFTYDKDSVNQVYEEYLYQKALADATFSFLPPDSKAVINAKALSREIVASMSIENDNVSFDSVYSSVAKHFALDVDSKIKSNNRAESVSKIAIDIQSNKDVLTKERLFSWHEMLFDGSPEYLVPKVVGGFRQGPVYVVKQSGMDEQVLYEAVPATQVSKEIDLLLSYINSNNEPRLIIKSAIAGFWFVTIHPFGDGNGRISRAVSDYVLSENLKYFSVSEAIEKHKKEYYAILEKTQNCSLDLTQWICWYLKTVTTALFDAQIEMVVKEHAAQFIRQLNPKDYNSRQLFILTKLADGSFVGKLNADKWRKMTKCPSATATRDLTDLVNKQALIRLGEGSRNIHYVLNPKFIPNKCFCVSPFNKESNMK